jgi:hypothetical protein
MKMGDAEKYSSTADACDIAMARFLIAEVGVDDLVAASEGPMRVQLDMSGTEQAQVVESMSQWLWAEIKQHRLISPANAAAQRFVIARFRKVVRLRKGFPPRAFYDRAA